MFYRLWVHEVTVTLGWQDSRYIHYDLIELYQNETNHILHTKFGPNGALLMKGNLQFLAKFCWAVFRLCLFLVVVLLIKFQ